MVSRAINKVLTEPLSDEDLFRLDGLIKSSLVLRSDYEPADWYEHNMVMPSTDTYPGPVSYHRTPYWREPTNCFHPDHPALDVSIMGPAQMGKSVMVINAIIAYCISQNPVNILFLVGHTDLAKEAMQKIDYVIKCCGLQHLITPAILKKRNNRTGDTADKKEFRGVSLLVGSITNHNLLRQNTARITIADDLDAGRMSKEDTGSTIGLIKGRVKASEDRSKRAWVSTPQVKGRSMIEIQFNKSDKRFWFVDCPCCGEKITWSWMIQVDDRNTAGITYKLDPVGRVIERSVGYICQKCANFFDDRDKLEIINTGLWVPTQEWLEPYHYGYKMTGLYAPPGMTSWFSLANRFNACSPEGAPRNEDDYKTWINIDIGDLYEEPGVSIKSRELEKNIREYPIGSVPDELSVRDGNGHIVLLTFVADLGGRYIGDQIKSEYDDARLDWEIMGHSESGSTYSIDHGSIGTFTNAYLGKKDESRELWSYDMAKPNNVWRVVSEILARKYGKMRIQLAGIDTGFGEHFVWNYIDRMAGQMKIIGLKGDKESKPRVFGQNVKNWKFGQARANQYMLEVGHIKDMMAACVSLHWDRQGKQPAGFMNFPTRGGGKYELSNYFLHYESEQRVMDPKKGTFIWEKKTSTVQNHVWDLRVYSQAVKEILMFHVLKEIGADPKESSWRDFSEWLLSQWGTTSALPA